MKVRQGIITGIWIVIFIGLLILQLIHWSNYGSLEWYDILMSFMICSILCIFGYEISLAIASIWKRSE